MKSNKNPQKTIAALFAGALLYLASCNSGVNTSNISLPDDINNANANNAKLVTLAVKPPIPGVDVPFMTYTVNASKGMTIETPTGSTIEIPAGIFVDKNGKPINGDVQIDFREFHNATDIIASGIPMHNPETGEFMETAGMFEIKGAQNGEPIFVQDGKEIQVDLASFNEGDQFNFYELGQENGRWKDKGTAKCQPNTKKAERIAAIKKQMYPAPVKPKKHTNADNYVFDLDVNYSMFPELKPFKNVVWEYAGEGKDPQQNEWIFAADWTKIQLNPSAATGFYELVLTAKDKNFKTLVRPVLDEKNYDAALALFNETKMKEYAEIKKAQELEMERLKVQADLTRSFAVSGFGIYNWDIWHQSGRTRCIAQPEFDQMVSLDKNVNKRINYFLVSNKQRSVVQYDASTLKNFSFNPADNNALLAVLPEGKVAIFAASKFKNLDLSKIVKDNQAIMKMATATVKIKDLKDLDGVINQAMAI